MKEYRVKEENINQILISRIATFITVIAFAAVVTILYLYYLHSRIGPFNSWAEFFRASTIKTTGIICGIMVIIALVWGFLSGKKSLQSLVIMVNSDHVAWKVFDNTERKIYYNDMIKIKDNSGLSLKSRFNKKIVLMIPKQIDDFDELQHAIEANHSTHN